MKAGAKRVAPGPLAAVPAGDDPCLLDASQAAAKGGLKVLLSFDPTLEALHALEHHAHLDVEPVHGLSRTVRHAEPPCAIPAGRHARGQRDLVRRLSQIAPASRPVLWPIRAGASLAFLVPDRGNMGVSQVEQLAYGRRLCRARRLRVYRLTA